MYFYEEDGVKKAFNTNYLDKNKKQNEKMAERALRVLRVAYLDVDVLQMKLIQNNIENNLVFIGFIGMIDPPRKGVKGVC